MDNLYFGSGTQEHLSSFRNWDFSPSIVFSLTGLKSSFQLENNFSLKGWAFCSTFFAFFRKWDFSPTIMLFGTGTLVPALFYLMGLKSHHSYLFDGTEVPFPKSLKNQLVSRFFVTFYKKGRAFWLYFFCPFY